MKKVIIIGCSGSGKSTFARKLAAKTYIPLYYLDMIWHKPDKTTITTQEFDEQLALLLRKDAWILDGNYQRTLERRLQACDTVFFLDIPMSVCLESAKARIGRQREDLPWLETELEEEFRQWICDYPDKSRPKIMALLDKYKAEKQIIIFTSRDEVEAYLTDNFS